MSEQQIPQPCERTVRAVKESLRIGESWVNELVCDDPAKAREALTAHFFKCHPYLSGNESQKVYKWTPAGMVEEEAKPYDVMEHRDLAAMVNAMQPGDVINFFRSPPATWRMLCGREGYELVRGESIIATVTTCLN